MSVFVFLLVNCETWPLYMVSVMVAFISSHGSFVGSGCVNMYVTKARFTLVK